MFKRESWLKLAAAAFACALAGAADIADAANNPPPAAASAAPSGPARRAFVLGVQRYSDSHIQPLSRSDTDAGDVAADLEQAGFDKKNIAVATDLRGKADFDKRFDTFLATVQEGDVVFFFFSGHGVGVEAADTNFLLLAAQKSLFQFTREKLPDAERRDTIVSLRMPSFVGQYEEEEIVKNGVSTSEILQAIGRRKPKVAFVVLDACRSLATPSSDSGASDRAADAGSQLVPSKDLPPGFMVLYSASRGEQAVESFGRDDNRRNSLFTEVLRSEMPRPGQTLLALGARVSLVTSAFANKGGYQQDPETYQNLGRASDFALIEGVGAAKFPASSDQCEGSQADWDQISQHPDREALERHRKRFASCATAELARRALVNLVSSSEEAPAAPVAAGDSQLDDCDRLAAADNDTARPPEAPGVPLEKIDAEAARKACDLSIKRNPRVVRYLFNLGRAEQAAANAMRLDDPARPQTWRRAYLALEDAAQRGYVAALYSLAMQINYGEPTEADNERANDMLEKAADQGFPPAAYALGLRYKEGAFGKTRNFKQAHEWLAKAAESGSVPAMVEVGEDLWYAWGVDSRNPRRAVEWLQRAAAAGSNRAKYNLGVHYYYGFVFNGEHGEVTPFSVKPDLQQALLWFGRAAESGDPASQYSLAFMMGAGKGLPNPQPEISERYYRLAAKGGDEDAEIEFADRLLSGHVLVKPENGNEEVIDLLQRALSHGSARAALRLAKIYRNGVLGEGKSPLKAMAYAYRAIELSAAANPTTTDGNPFNEISAGIMLAEMADNHEAEDSNGNPLLTKDEVDRLERFYGAVDPVSKKVRTRAIDVPLRCGNYNVDWQKVWVWDWGRFESPTEPQFRSLERETGCNNNDALRRTLSAVFERAKKSKVAFADLIQEEIAAAKKTQ
jgi:TPR repeat protein